MCEALISINTIESNPTNDSQKDTFIYTEQIQQLNNKAPIVLCGWCGTVEVQLGNNKTICPNCGE